MRYFPVFFDLRNARVVVIGGGEEALRKVRLLAKTEAAIEIVAPVLHPELAAMTKVKWSAKSYAAKHLKGAALVISSVQAMNIEVSRDAKRMAIPINAVDDAKLSTFIIPAIVDRDPVIVAIGTEGTAPVLAQNIRAKVDALLPLNLGVLAQKAADLRQLVAEKLSYGLPRRLFWNAFFFGAVAQASKDNDAVAYELALGDELFNHAQGRSGNTAHLVVPSALDLLTLREHRMLMEADYIVVGDGVPQQLLEMARRDALRLAPHQVDTLEHVTGNILHITSMQVKSAPFHVHEDLSDAILRAAI